MEFLDKFDRQKLQKITLVVIATLTLLALVLLLVIIIASVEGDPTPGNDINPPKVDADDIEFETVTVAEDQLSKGSLVLVNTSHQYKIPTDLNLVNIFQYRSEHRGNADSTYNLPDSSQQLEAHAMENAHNMLVALGNATGDHSIMIASAFRTYEDQASYAIPAGYSDSHTGLIMALTVLGGGTPYLHDESNSVLNNWLVENAHRYGFVVRYPADKVALTGVEDYTYAYRFVGLPHAKYMHDNNLCLEEYIEYLKTKTNKKDMLSVKIDDGTTYMIYYAEFGTAGEIPVPVQTPNPDGSTNYPYSLSGTNEGGIVVTVKLN